jgi:hypothetical protein
VVQFLPSKHEAEFKLQDHTHTHKKILRGRSYYYLHFIFFFNFYLLAVLGFELTALHLLDRHSIAWAMPPTFFVILETGSCFLFRPAWTVITLFYASYHHWDDRSVTPHPDFLFH